MMHYRVEIMPTAREGLLEIGEYIALDSPTRAISFVDEITDSLRKTLSIFPETGRVVEDLGFIEEIRMIPHGNYNSYYRVIQSKGLVEILFILNAKRDLSRFLGQMNP